MTTTITVNNLSELKAVAAFNGDTVNTAELEISFPYPYEVEVPEGEKEELSFEDFKETYLT